MQVPHRVRGVLGVGLIAVAAVTAALLFGPVLSIVVVVLCLEGWQSVGRRRGRGSRRRR